MPLPDKLVIISHKHHFEDASGSIHVGGGFGVIANEFSHHFSELTLCVPVHTLAHDTSTPFTYRPNVHLRRLPSYNSRTEFVMRLPKILSALNLNSCQGHLIYAMCPNDLGLIGAIAAKWHKLPLFASIDTDRAQRITTRQYSAPRRFLKHAVTTTVINGLLVALLENNPVFVTGDLFLGERKWWRQWIKSTHRGEELCNIQPKVTPSDPVHVVFAGRLSPEKNIPLLLEAVNRLSARHRGHLTLTIIGDGHMRDQLEQKARHLGLSRITFSGAIANEELRRSRFLSADILVLPSLEERQGKVLTEAMACGIPVVASRTGGIPTIISDGINGLLFDPTNVENLIECIHRLATDTGLRERLAKSGLEFARKHSLDAEVEKLLAVVETWHDQYRA